MKRNTQIRPIRLAAAIAGVTMATAALSGTAFAADDVKTPSAHEAHVAHVNHVVHAANEAAKTSAAAHAAHVAHEAHTIAAANAASRATSSAAAHAAHEAHRIAAANAASRSAARTQLPAAPAAATSGYSSPVPAGTRLSQPFGVPNSGYAAGYHTGMDFAVSTGTPLYAVGNATVVSAGWAGAYGNSVTLRLADGHYALYAHMSSLGVVAGETVSAGEQIGRSGSTGNSTGPHLHLEIRTTNSYGAVINPATYLQSKGVSF
ncbi:M23 family metallopeptidase [Peterkaempfera sp. SMS 1(5)a]|uniref:M23 family metallopeptidase n=1 Tax=Peterkaempfera podocarpi TaxID=3232308 RepID=UPI0036722524